MKHAILSSALSVIFLLPTTVFAEDTSCSITYNLSGWSALYQSYEGTGIVTCTNGQSAHVSLRQHGGGLTFGVLDIEQAKGKFAGVKDIQDIYGTYFSMDVHAGFARAGDARGLFKGYISFGGAGTGGGYTLGTALGGLTIR